MTNAETLPDGGLSLTEACEEGRSLGDPLEGGLSLADDAEGGLSDPAADPRLLPGCDGGFFSDAAEPGRESPFDPIKCKYIVHVQIVTQL